VSRWRGRLSGMAAGSSAQPGLRGALLKALLWSCVTLMLYVVLAAYLFDYRYGMLAASVDCLLLLPLLFVINMGSRFRWAALAAVVGVGFFAVLGHAIKYELLGAPVVATDVGPAWQLLNILPGLRKAAAWGVLALVVMFVISVMWPRRGGARWLMALPVIMIGWYLAVPLMEQVGLEDADDPRLSGGVAYLSHDIGQLLLHGADGPTADEVNAALALLPTVQASTQLVSRRNVHIVLLETLWDTTQLAGYKFSRDPWDERFRLLWKMGHQSHILSPVFGGATANAEFEALCGMPAGRGQVEFESGLKQDMYCLPRLLRDAGYTTIASHPYKSNFWNREAAYRHVGFNGYFPMDAYELDDMDGMFLSDRSNFTQVRGRELATASPRLSYVVSLSSHYPFDRNKAVRPDLVSVVPDEGHVGSYANAIAWSTAAFMDYVESVLSSDPTALVVAFGDHAPVLGSNPNPYVRAGLRGGRQGDDLVALSSAPLLVINGEQGPMAMGDMPLYQLPGRLLELLQPGVHLHGGVFGQDHDRARRFLGKLLVESETGWSSCDPEANDCDSFAKRLRSMRAVRNDLTHGSRHALAALGQPAPMPLAMQINRPFPSCSMVVEQWGPMFTTQGQAFNEQPNGNSALWFQIEEARGDLKIEIAGQMTDLSVVGKAASAGFGSPDFISKPGNYPVRAFCEGATPIELGTFQVLPSPETAALVQEDNTSDICSIEVSIWGPQHTMQGEVFNPQSNGNAAFWLGLEMVSGKPELLVGGTAVPLMVDGQTGSASISNPSFIQHPGDYPVQVRCLGQDPITLGTFRVDASDQQAQVAVQKTCEVDVVDWGPRTAARGQQFNPQHGGGSALWVRMPQASTVAAIEVGGVRTQTHASGDLLSAVFADPEFLTKPGNHAVRAICANGAGSAAFGEFAVQP
jgi:hypothetical protein